MEAWEDPVTKVQFYFSHSDAKFTTGVMVIPAGAALPKHNRPSAVENLVQVAGRCEMTVFDDSENKTIYELKPGSYLSMEKGQFHIHANPYGEPSYTLFKAVGDITDIVATLKKNFNSVRLETL